MKASAVWSESCASLLLESSAPKEEVFASWFVKWWHRQGRHIDLSANAVPADQKKLYAVSESEIWPETPETD
jgi:hypothetical protein